MTNNRRINVKIASVSDGVINLPLTLASICSSTVMSMGLANESRWTSGVEDSTWTDVASIYRYGVLRHRWAQSFKKVTTASTSSVSGAPSGASVPCPLRTKQKGRAASHISTSFGSSWNNTLSERTCCKSSFNVVRRARTRLLQNVLRRTYRYV